MLMLIRALIVAAVLMSSPKAVAASGSAPGRTTVLASGPTRTAAAATDSRNRVLWQQEKVNGTPTHTASLTYDPAGNLKSDGKYFYQYDA